MAKIYHDLHHCLKLVGMLRVRHLDSSTWLCWWQGASLLWNKGANCPWWTADQTSASKMHDLEMFFGAKRFWMQLVKQFGDRGINTKDLFQNLVLPNRVFLCFSYSNCIVAFSCSMWYGWMWNDMTGGVTQLRQFCRWGVNWNFPQSHWHCSSFERSQPIEESWGVQHSSTMQWVGVKRLFLNKCKWRHVESLCPWEFYSFVSRSKYPSTVETQVSSEEHFSHGINVNWLGRWDDVSRCYLQALHQTELPCDAGNQHPP